jgi:hypothetical protein
MINRTKSKGFVTAKADSWAERYLNSWVYLNLKKQNPNKYNSLFPLTVSKFNSAMKRFISV